MSIFKDKVSCGILFQLILSKTLRFLVPVEKLFYYYVLDIL